MKPKSQTDIASSSIFVKNYSTTQTLTLDQSVIEYQHKDNFDTFLFLPEGKSRQGEGGLRKKSHFKTSLPDKPLITVITVVFNAAKSLEKTILSVIGQTYDNVEYIIIDAGSTDNTLNIISKYEHAIDYWSSEEDRGIYDGMNKGISLTTGDWICFMNSGDCFIENNILESIFKDKTYIGVNIIYGDHEVRYLSGRKRNFKSGNIKNLRKGSQFCHQSVFVSTHLHKKNKFNIENKIGADFEFFYKAYRNREGFFYVDKVISSITSDGLSDLNRVGVIVSWWNVVNKNTKVNIHYVLRITKEIVKYKIKKMIRR